jgi:hypothetical protein
MKWLILFILMITVYGQAKVVSMTLARAGNVVLTSREVILSGVIERWRLVQSSKKIKPQSDWILIPDSEAFKTHLAQVLTETLINLEADSFGAAQVSANEVRQNSAPFLEAMTKFKDWQIFKFSDAEVEGAFIRSLRARAYLKFRTESEGIKITDQQVQEFYDKQRIKFGQVTLESVKESIREHLFRQSQEARLKDWFETLKRKFRARYLSPQPSKNG